MSNVMKLFGQRNYSLLFFQFCCIGILASCNKEDDPAPLAVPLFQYETTAALEFGIPLEVQFQDQSTSVDATTKYKWDFGDGTTSTEASPKHTYEKGGTYTITLTLTNADNIDTKLSKDVTLSSPIVGTWKLDSLAPATIDSFAVKYGIKTAIEFGNSNGWDGKKWTEVSDLGYSTFWSNVIFKENYLGRKLFFAVEYTFTADGKFTRKENGKLPGVVYFSPEDDQTLESVDWKNADGVSLNAWKSGTYNWSMEASTKYTGRSDIKINGGAGGFLGLYFAGSELQTPADLYTYTISLVNDNQLIVTGVNNLFNSTDNLFVLKFKKVQ